MTPQQFLSKLGPDARPTKTAHGWQCRCPAHDDNKPSLSVSEGTAGRILLKDFGGCTAEQICAAIGLTLADLMPARNGAKGTPPPRRTDAQPAAAFDWQPCHAAFADAEARKLADWRGLSLEFVQWLHSQGMVGLCKGVLAFPNHGNNGKVVSCHCRPASGAWFFEPKGQRTAPLILGDPAQAGFIMAFESQFDAFAVADKFGWHLSGGLPDTAIFCTRGAGNARLATGRFSKEAICYAFEQNDPAEPGKLSPGAQWTAELAAAADCKVLRVATPPEHKDPNDWTRAGATKAEIETAIAAAKQVRVETQTAPAPPVVEPDPGKAEPEQPKKLPPVIGRPLSALIRHEGADPDELLRYRFLCRLAILLVCGPTGIGKSALAMQCMILWALGKPCFGITPARPLKSVLIQGENDDGDLAEMRDGVIAGLQLTEAEAKQAMENVIVWREDQRTGFLFFCEVARPLLEAHKPDLLWIDPALCYLGGETNSQKDVGGFLRNNLNPLLREFNCAAVIIHHTNKPPIGKEKPDWQAGDFAYLGSGSAEWANASRAVLAFRSIGSHEVFELRAGKRGARLGWQEPDGSKSFSKYLAHATESGVICWREVDPEDLDKGGRPTRHDEDDLFSLLPSGGLTTTEWKDKADTESGISRASFYRLKKVLQAQKRITQSVTSDKWQPLKKP